MSRPFTCSVCGTTTTRRSHFMWLVAIVGFFNGQNWVSDGPVCSRCAPSWATTFGRVLWVLLIICILLLVWEFGLSRLRSDMTPNPSIQSGRAGSVMLLVASQRPAADFRR
jgi:hypothetical protein